MAIVRMQKLSICANKKNRKAILEFLQSLGAVEIFTDAIDDEDLRRKDTQAARSSFERSADSFDKVLKLLNTYAPGKKQACRRSAPGLFSIRCRNRRTVRCSC